MSADVARTQDRLPPGRVEPGEELLADAAWRDPKGRPYSDVRAQWEELWQ